MELKAMMDDCCTFEADEAVVPDATMDDMDMEAIMTFLLKKFREALPKQTDDGRKPAVLNADEIASLLIKDKNATDFRTLRWRGTSFTSSTQSCSSSPGI